METADETSETRRPKVLTPTQFFLRGLAISLPSILTVVILIWLARGVYSYIIFPASTTVRYIIAKVVDESRPSLSLQAITSGPALPFSDHNYAVTQKLSEGYLQRFRPRLRTPEPAADPQDEPSRRLSTLTGSELLDELHVAESQRVRWLLDAVRDEQNRPQLFVPLGSSAVPYDVFAVVAQTTPPGERGTSAIGVYMDYVAERYFGSFFLLNAVAVVLIIMLIYFLGRFVTARLGGWLVHRVETDLLGRLPVVRNVYGSVKQVTDFLFSENQVEYRRVVAIEYPRRGIWSLGLVTGESMLEITTAVGEPCITVLIPSSPMPVTGYTMSVPRSEVLDLDISVDNAFQFCISCGVLVPPHQRVTPELLQRELTRRLSERMKDSGTSRVRILPNVPSPEADGAENPANEGPS